jgi:hypothetical protein
MNPLTCVCLLWEQGYGLDDYVSIPGRSNVGNFFVATASIPNRWAHPDYYPTDTGGKATRA